MSTLALPMRLLRPLALILAWLWSSTVWSQACTVIALSIPNYALIESGDDWKWDTGTDHGTAWRDLSFDDSSWRQATTQFGFGDGDEASGPDPSEESNPSFLFRKKVSLTGSVSNAKLSGLFDDSIAVWVNETLITHYNIDDTDSYGDYASSSSSDNEAFSALIPEGLLVTGDNIIAVMVKNSSATSSDISFDLTLEATVEQQRCSTEDLYGGTTPPTSCPAAPEPILTSAGIPILESRPSSKFALYLDFDGGNYGGDTPLSGFDRDGDPSTFNAEEQAEIKLAWQRVVDYYAMFNVNVTTDASFRDYSEIWGWIVITDDETGGRGKMPGIGTRDHASAYAGSGSITGTDRSRRLAHELGHNFILEHNGYWDGGSFDKWEDSAFWDGEYGSVMGGGGDGKINGWALSTADPGPTYVQDSMAVIEEWVSGAHEDVPSAYSNLGLTDGWAPDDFDNTAPAPLCDRNYYLAREGVLGHPQDQDEFGIDWRGGSVTFTVDRAEVASTDAVLEIVDSAGAVKGGAGTHDLPAGHYTLRVKTRSNLSNGYDRAALTDLTEPTDIGRSELGAYVIAVNWDGIESTLDTDGDGVPDISDAFPDDPNESVDTDGDGTGNNADDDDDGDTKPDSADNCPLVANANQLDTDSDGAGDACDTDDDGDGDLDSADNCPLTANANQLDTDSDGSGNACDTDDDNDGLSDVEEALLGTNPLLRDTDGDSWSDKEEVEEGSDPLSPTSEPDLGSGLPIWLLYQATKQP